MSEQIEKIDITFKDLEAHDVRVLANAEKMHAFIDEWRDHIREVVKYSTLDGDAYSALESLKAHFNESLSEHGITDLFDW
jgi:hypothetical protein